MVSRWLGEEGDFECRYRCLCKCLDLFYGVFFNERYDEY